MTDLLKTLEKLPRKEKGWYTLREIAEKTGRPYATMANLAERMVIEGAWECKKVFIGHHWANVYHAKQ